MKARAIAGVALAGLLAACSGGGGNSAAGNNTSDTTAAAAPCTSASPDTNYAGFSGGQIADFAKRRKAIVTAKLSDSAAWDPQAKEFATYFLDQIGLKPDSLCPHDYKAKRDLISAETEFEARAASLPGNKIPKEEMAAYVRVLYETAGMTVARGETDLDALVTTTVGQYAQQRAQWGDK